MLTVGSLVDARALTRAGRVREGALLDGGTMVSLAWQLIRDGSECQKSRNHGRTSPYPTRPPPDVHIQPGGAVGRLPPVLLIKPVRTFQEPLQRRPGQREPTRYEVVAEEVEAALGCLSATCPTRFSTSRSRITPCPQHLRICRSWRSGRLSQTVRTLYAHKLAAAATQVSVISNVLST